MSFIYCDKCDWQQDDFWSWHYNPIQTFFSYVRSFRLWLPRILRGDPPTFPVHSWHFLWREFKKMLRKFRAQRFWTWQSYVKAGKPPCPKCGEHYGID